MSETPNDPHDADRANEAMKSVLQGGKISIEAAALVLLVAEAAIRAERERVVERIVSMGGGVRLIGDRATLYTHDGNIEHDREDAVRQSLAALATLSD